METELGENIGEEKLGYSLGVNVFCTGADELAKKGGHSWPPIVLLHAMESSEKSFVTSSGGVMEGLY